MRLKSNLSNHCVPWFTIALSSSKIPQRLILVTRSPLTRRILVILTFLLDMILPVFNHFIFAAVKASPLCYSI